MKKIYIAVNFNSKCLLVSDYNDETNTSKESLWRYCKRNNLNYKDFEIYESDMMFAFFSTTYSTFINNELNKSLLGLTVAQDMLNLGIEDYTILNSHYKGFIDKALILYQQFGITYNGDCDSNGNYIDTGSDYYEAN